MTRTLITAACLGLSLSAASACNYDRSAQTEVDQTVVASVTAEQAKPMSTPVIDPAAPTGQSSEETLQ